MGRRYIALGLAIAVPALAPAGAGIFDPPMPEAYARAEDRERARLLGTPCAPVDEGRGCERENGALRRKSPCSYRIDQRTIGYLPTDECYVMETARRYRGVWIDEFEGQRFIPEGTNPPGWPGGDTAAPGWRERFEEARLANIWLDIERTRPARAPGSRSGRYFIEFTGRKTLFPGAYGHMGMSGHEIIVDAVIALRECPAEGPCA